VEVCAPDCVLSDNSRELHGRDAIQAATQAYFDAFSDMRLEVVSLHVEGNTVFQEWRSSGTHDGEMLGIPATGRRAETTGAAIDEFGDDGLVHRSALYWDSAKLLQDIGVLPAAEVSA
jgi:steroid delta-isomerase-like uncharacterized protein